jgi:hypothetical protein
MVDLMLNSLNFKEWNEMKNLLLKHRLDSGSVRNIIEQFIKEAKSYLLKKLLNEYLSYTTAYDLDTFYDYYGINQE